MGLPQQGERKDRMDWEFQIPSIKVGTIEKIPADKARRNRHEGFLSHEDQCHTYGQLDKHTNMAANALLERVLNQDDKVAPARESCPEFLHVWLSLVTIKRRKPPCR